MKSRIALNRCCCTPPCEHCTGTIPKYLRVTLSNGVVSPMLAFTSTHWAAKCMWVYEVAGQDTWFAYLVDLSGQLYLRVQWYHIIGGTTYVTTWEISVQSYVPLDCCDEFDGLVLSCVSSNEPTSLCTSGVTARIDTYCTYATCNYCLDGSAPHYVMATLTIPNTGPTDPCYYWAGTFVCELGAYGAGACQWRSANRPLIGPGWAQVTVTVTATGVEVYLAIKDNGQNLVYSITWTRSGTNVDCMFNGYQLTSYTNTPATIPCPPATVGATLNAS
jgi:hypothetical protein